MRRFSQSLIPFFIALSLLVGSPAAAGEIVDGTGQEMIEDLLKDLADLRIAGKIGKKVVGRGASGTLRTLLTSSDTVICGFWQMQQHALMNELAMKGVPAETYRKAQRLGELIDRNCDKVINPEAYRTGGSMAPDDDEEETEEGEEESDSEGGEATPLDPKTRCENECILPYSKWRELERDVARWKKWQKKREQQLKNAREENRKAAADSRAADKDAKEKEAHAQKIKGEAEAAGWPKSSIDPVGTALRDARNAAAAARRAKTRHKEAWAKLEKAKENVASAKEMVDYFRKWADQARAIYEACVKRCMDQIAYEAPKVSIGSLRRFQTETRNAGYAMSSSPILTAPAARGTRRILAPMSGGYARHIAGQARHGTDRHLQIGGGSEPRRGEVAVRDPEPRHESEATQRNRAEREPKRRRRGKAAGSEVAAPMESMTQPSPRETVSSEPQPELRTEPVMKGSDPRLRTESISLNPVPQIRTESIPTSGTRLGSQPIQTETLAAPRNTSLPAGAVSPSTGQMRQVKPPVLVIPAGARN